MNLELKRSRGNMAKTARALGITERMIGLRITNEKVPRSVIRFSNEEIP